MQPKWLKLRLWSWEYYALTDENPARHVLLTLISPLHVGLPLNIGH